jgi:ferredoxin/flavodoxin---NADP+ reductase
VNSDIHKVLKIDLITPSTCLLQVERKDITFRAGQCFSLAPVGLGINREYSIYSGEHDDYLAFLIKIIEDGTVTQAIKDLKVGDRVEIAGPYGEFCLKPNQIKSSQFLFIATGTGIAPFHSFVKTFPELDYKIIQGIRYNNEKYGIADYETERYVACVSQEETSDFKGRVTEYLAQTEISPETITYLCGNRAMIIDAYDILSEKNIGGDNIITEVFF